MKKLIAIFSVILTMGSLLPNAGWGADKCRPQSCKGGNESVNVIYGGANNSGECFGCEYGTDDYECDDNAVVGQKDENGYIKAVFVCDRATIIGVISAGNSWNPITDIGWCSSTEIKPNDFPDTTNANCGYSLDGTTLDYSEPMIASLPSGGMPCKICKCVAGYKKSTDGKSCELDTSAQDTCENAPSNGKWDSANSKCLCGATDRNDGKGDAQTYETPDAKCKCADPSHSWNGEKCEAPDAADVEACERSGGNWIDGECKCDERTQTQGPDKKTCVDNPAFENCTNSGGDWPVGATNCTCARNNNGLVGPDSTGKCKCQDSTKTYDSDAEMCTNSAKTWCTTTGGVWTGPDADHGTCNCDIPAKNIKEVNGSKPVRCECKNSDYEFNSDHTQGCKLTDMAEKRRDAFEQLKEDCEEKWGSTWYPDSWEWELPNGDDNPDGRDSSKWRCGCNGKGVTQRNEVSCQCDAQKGYLLQSHTDYRNGKTQYQCEREECSDLQTVCPTAGGTYEYLGVIDGRNACLCECQDGKQYDSGIGQCVAITNPLQAYCDSIPGAKIGSRTGRCLCESTRLSPVNGKCPSAGNNNSSVAGSSKTDAEIRDKTTKISTLYSELTEMSGNFDRSHWKTASGNFNGARLASDSVAGVVLGTVGGVVTSNIIKKNQVKGGFEKLQCTVGGQMVADFGDQFQVGIR